MNATAGGRVRTEDDALSLTQRDRGAHRVQRRQFIAVMNDLNRAPAAFAQTSDLVERQGGMATIDVADYIRVGFEHDVGVNQS